MVCAVVRCSHEECHFNLLCAGSKAGADAIAAIDPWARSALEKIGGALFRYFGGNPSSIFTKIDVNNDGQLSTEVRAFHACNGLRRVCLEVTGWLCAGIHPSTEGAEAGL
jgi:hypothetical protein